ncbi:MAG: glutamate 5-kinase [Acidimicrobiales bacterium]
MKIVAKIGSSSLTTVTGEIDHSAVAKLCQEVADLKKEGHHVVVVTSAAISAGLGPLGYSPDKRPKDAGLLRAASAVGQIALMSTYKAHLASNGLTAGQVLLAPTDLWHRNRYLKSRGTLEALLARSVVPVINENDAVADDEIRFGDNDRLAALVAHLIDANCLVLLTDTAGVFTADPRHDADASLIEEIVEIDQALELAAGGAGSRVGRGGMASKLAAAKIAAWSGVETTIAQSDRPNVLREAVEGVPGVGTVFRPRAQRLPARKLWIAFALPPSGRIVVDRGAREALQNNQRSLLPAGVTGAEGAFQADEAVELVDHEGEVFAKGLSQWCRSDLDAYSGMHSSDLPREIAEEVVHRDDLVMLP